VQLVATLLQERSPGKPARQRTDR